MSADTQKVDFRLFKKTYEVACPSDQRELLTEAIELLKKRTQKVHEIDPSASMDRLAVVTALNLSHDYLRLTRELQEDLLGRIAALSARAQKTLDQGKEARLS